MIFGDRDELALQVVRFDPPWGDVSVDADSVWAGVTIWIDGVNVTEHRRHGTDRVRDDVHLPLLPLARWCAASRSALRFEERSQLGNLTAPHHELDHWGRSRPPAGFDDDAWLDLRDAWWSRHFTGAATLDVVIPSIGFMRNDDRALISWRSPALPRADRSFVRPSGTATVSWDIAATALDDFVEAVEGWAPADAYFAATDDPSSALGYYTGLRSEELAAFGFRPEAIEEPAADPLAQVIRDLTHRTAVGDAQQHIVEFVRSGAGQGAGAWWSVRQRLVAGNGDDFEQDGHDAAMTVRRLLDLNEQPVVAFDDVARELDIHLASTRPAGMADRMVVVGEAAGDARVMVLDTPRTATPWGERFEHARAVGHLMLDPLRGSAIGAASGPQSMASRRRRSGAFAAEFLLPTSALVEASNGVLDGVTDGTRFSDLLDRFGVGAGTGAYHLWNQGLLSSTEVRDDLIAAH